MRPIQTKHQWQSGGFQWFNNDTKTARLMESRGRRRSGKRSGFRTDMRALCGGWHKTVRSTNSRVSCLIIKKKQYLISAVVRTRYQAEDKPKDLRWGTKSSPNTTRPEKVHELTDSSVCIELILERHPGVSRRGQLAQVFF